MLIEIVSQQYLYNYVGDMHISTISIMLVTTHGNWNVSFCARCSL